jgi:hypothetical protein
MREYAANVQSFPGISSMSLKPFHPFYRLKGGLLTTRPLVASDFRGYLCPRSQKTFARAGGAAARKLSPKMRRRRRRKIMLKRRALRAQLLLQSRAEAREARERREERMSRLARRAVELAREREPMAPLTQQQQAAAVDLLSAFL